MSSDKKARPGAYLSATSHPLADCPLHAAFVAVGGKWKLTILYWLAREPHHFSGLLRRVAPISHKVLTEQLRELEADGLVERLVAGPVPAPVLYRLSGYGETVLPLVEEARVWGLAHLARMRGPGLVPTAAALGCGEVLASLGDSAGGRAPGGEQVRRSEPVACGNPGPRVQSEGPEASAGETTWCAQ